jgi:hypothetical protein
MNIFIAIVLLTPHPVNSRGHACQLSLFPEGTTVATALRALGGGRLLSTVDLSPLPDSTPLYQLVAYIHDTSQQQESLDVVNVEAAVTVSPVHGTGDPVDRSLEDTVMTEFDNT